MLKIVEQEHETIMEIMVLFYFKKGKEDFPDIIKQLGHKNKGFIQTRLGMAGVFHALFYRIKKIEKFHKLITHFRSDFKDVLVQIEISKRPEAMNIVYLNDFEPKVLSGEEFEEFINIFQLKLLQMDISVINRVLFEGIGEEYKELVDNLAERGYDTIVKLLYKKSLNKDDINDIIKMLPEDNELFSSQILNLIIERSDIYNHDTIETIYKNASGKEIKLKREPYFKSITTQNRIESFFRFYILEKDILSEVKYQFNHNSSKIHLLLPANPENYSYKGLKNSIVKDIKDCFYKFPYQTLKTFRKILFSEIEKDTEINREIHIVIGLDYDITKDKAVLERIHYNKWRDAIRNIGNGFCIIAGAVQKRDVFEVKPSWRSDIEFLLKDKEENTMVCIINRYMDYFRDIVDNLNMDETLEVQGFLEEIIEKTQIQSGVNKGKVKTEFKGYRFYVIDIKILKHFEVIEKDLGTNYQGKRKLFNTLEGVKLVVSSKKNKGVNVIPVLDVPIDLKGLWVDMNKEASIQNKETFYEVELDGDIIFDTKLNVIKYIYEKTDLSYVRHADLITYISIIFQEYKKRKDLKKRHMFPTVGVFDIQDKNGRKHLVVVHPFKTDLRTYGHNSVQKRLVEKIKNIGIDEKGDMAKVYYDINHIDSIEEWVRVVILGFSAGMPYAYAIRTELDVFGNLFIIGPSESGKSTTLKINMNYCYGTELKNPENIQSTSRLTFYSTETTTPSNWDDIDDMDDEAIAFIKSNSTFKGTRDRNTKDQQMTSEQTYPCFSGSANEKEWLAGKKNEAFRSRCFIIELTKRLNFDPKFDELFNIIKTGKVFGFYLLEKGIELAETRNSEENKTNYEKFVQMFKNAKENLLRYAEKHNITIRSRRISMYALLFLGWEIWNYLWLEKGLESPLLKRVLDFEDLYLSEIIKSLEEENQKILLEDIENVLNFFESEYLPVSEIYLYKNSPVLKSNFVSAYDKFARMRGYNTLGGKCKDLTELQNDILSINEKAKNYTCLITKAQSIDELNGQGQLEIFQKKKAWGVLFHYKEICRLFNKDPIKLMTIESSTDKNFDRATGKIDMDRVFRGQSKEQLEQLDILLERLKIISETNKGRDLELDVLAQVIEIEEGLDKSWIEDALMELIKEGSLSEPKPGFINFKYNKEVSKNEF